MRRLEHEEVGADVLEVRGRGQPARNFELERPLREDFGDDAAWAVYGDWLQQQDDPYGERIALEFRRGHKGGSVEDKVTRRIAKLDEDHRAAWLGPSLAKLREHEGFDGIVELSWEWGFITRASVGRHETRARAGPSLDAILHALLESTAARFLRRLRIRPGTDDIVGSLAQSTLAGQLCHLDLSLGSMTDGGAQQILEAAKKFAGIEGLDLRGNFISDAMCAQLSEVLPNVDVSSQRVADEAPRLAVLLAGKRVLWLDPHPENNVLAQRFMSSPGGGRWSGQRWEPVSITEVESAEAAALELTAAVSAGRKFDLILSHWGADEVADYHGERLANGPRLLAIMRQEDLRAPVILFSTITDGEARERTVLSLGACAYCVSVQALFREIEAVFT